MAIILGLAFARIGILHFTNPTAFDAIVPEYLGWPRFWTLWSGGLEIMLGIGLALPWTRAISARILFVLVILMSLANINMWINDIPFNGTRLSNTGHIIRMLIQVMLLATLAWLGRLPHEGHTHDRRN